MYDFYVQKCNKEWKVNPEKLSFYRHIFNPEFGFHQPTKDACKYCEWYKRLNANDHKSMKNNTMPTKIERHRPENIKNMIRDEHKNSTHTKQSLLILNKC